MNEVVCKRCGYQGNEFVEIIHGAISQTIFEFRGYTYPDVSKTKTIKDKKGQVITWNCPSCKAILVRHLGNYGYSNQNLKTMRDRLFRTSMNNERYLQRMDKVIGR